MLLTEAYDILPVGLITFTQFLVNEIKRMIEDRGRRLHNIAIELGRNDIKPDKDAVKDNRDTDREIKGTYGSK